MDEPQLPIVIRESRWKTGLSTLAICGLGFFLVNNVLGKTATPSPWLYVFATILIIGVICGIIETIQPSTLVLDPSGFTVRQFWRTKHTPWSDAANFRVRFNRSSRYVAYDAPRASVLFGAGRLPINWAMSPPISPS